MKKNNLQKILLLYVILLPILDILSFEFRKIFCTTWSPSTFIRPIIPVVLFIIIFLKKNFKLKFIIIAFIYCIYAIAHLLFFNYYLTGISYGTLGHELQYLSNYSFNILTLTIFMFIFYKQDIISLKNTIIISCSIYIFSIYLSIVTNTYSPTYIEGIGIKGWFESGNSLSAILILGLTLLLSQFNTNNKKIYLIILICMFEFFLLFLLGTRTAMFGGLLIAVLYIIFTLYFNLRNKINIKKLCIYLLIIISFITIIGIFILESKTIERRKYISSLDTSIDDQTGEVLHVTTDISNIYNNMKNNLLPSDYLSEAEKSALNSLYSFAKIHEVSCTDRRTQEFIYNFYLVKYQKNIFSILFGNGLLNNYAELVLEIELPALIFNFGVLGFALYFIPFLLALIYILYNGFKFRKNIDTEFLVLLSGLLFSVLSTCYTGVTFFNTSSATFVIIIIVLLLNKINNYKINSL